MDNEHTYNKAYTGDDTVPAFLTFCIEQFKNHRKISGKRAMQTLSDAGVLGYLAEHQDALHLESRKWILKEMDELVKNRTLLQ